MDLTTDWRQLFHLVASLSLRLPASYCLYLCTSVRISVCISARLSGCMSASLSMDLPRRVSSSCCSNLVLDSDAERGPTVDDDTLHVPSSRGRLSDYTQFTRQIDQHFFLLVPLRNTCTCLHSQDDSSRDLFTCRLGTAI